MFYKTCFFFLVTSIQAESNFKKSIHYYIGLCKFIRQSPNTMVTTKYVEDGEEKDREHAAYKQSEQAEGVYEDRIKKQLVIFHHPESNEPPAKLLNGVILKSKDRMIFKHGFHLSLYLGEIMDAISFGICISNENYTEDSIYFNPSTERMENCNSPEIKNNNKETDNEKHLKGIVFLHRKSPVMVGGFIQIQDDDIDSYSIAAKLSLTIGVLNTYGKINELRTFCNDNFITKNEILLNTTPLLQISLSLIFKLYDVEGAVHFGCSWAPIGIDFKQNGYKDLEASNITQIEFKSNHLQFFISISLGFLFE